MSGALPTIQAGSGLPADPSRLTPGVYLVATSAAQAGPPPTNGPTAPGSYPPGVGATPFGLATAAQKTASGVVVALAVTLMAVSPGCQATIRLGLAADNAGAPGAVLLDGIISPAIAAPLTMIVALPAPVTVTSPFWCLAVAQGSGPAVWAGGVGPSGVQQQAGVTGAFPASGWATVAAETAGVGVSAYLAGVANPL